MAEPFPFKIWADPDHKAKYDEAVARVKEKNPEAVVPSRLDPRGFHHVMKVLEDMHVKEAEPDTAPSVLSHAFHAVKDILGS